MRHFNKAAQQLVCGIHAARHTLETAAEEVLELWYLSDSQNPALSAIITLARQHGITPQPTSRKALEQRVGDLKHQGVVLRRRSLKKIADEQDPDLLTLVASSPQPPLLLVLDGVQDPRNLGACLRTADAAGVTAVVIPLHRGVGVTATVEKVASGAAATVPLIEVRNLAQSLEKLKAAGIWLVGAAHDARQNLYQVDMNVPTAILLGAEDLGLRRLTREHCDYLVKIPMLGKVQSLNVSVAAGICLYEAVRQRQSVP